MPPDRLPPPYGAWRIRSLLNRWQSEKIPKEPTGRALQLLSLLVDPPDLEWCREFERAPRWVDHTPIEMEADSGSVQIRDDDLDRLAMTVARIALTAPVAVIEPPELAHTLRRLATHLAVSPL
ncbi:hypothetical protein GCM10028833_41810 [Glycomyces tarimensis]